MMKCFMIRVMQYMSRLWEALVVGTIWNGREHILFAEAHELFGLCLSQMLAYGVYQMYHECDCLS